MKSQKYISIDMGGSGVRISMASFNGKMLSFQPVYRFINDFVTIHSVIYWNFLNTIKEIEKGLRKAASLTEGNLVSLGVDSAGVSFGLLDKNGELLSNPLYTRVAQDKNVEKWIYSKISKQELYSLTGLQTIKLNSLYHIARLLYENSPTVENAHSFLMMPDLINYVLTKTIVSEYTIASTSNFLNANTKQWDNGLINALSLPKCMFSSIVNAGTKIGSLTKSVSETTGLKDINVIATASHDTAAALAYLPLKEDNYAYLSSGTWGMFGVDLDVANCSKKAMEINFANEGGVFENIRFLHNSVNLWILEGCIKAFNEEGKRLSYNDFMLAVQATKPFIAFIDVKHKDFLITDNMVMSIQNYCCCTSQYVPQTLGEIARVVYDSLVIKNKLLYQNLSQCLNKKIDILHVVGGGSKDEVMNQMLADALGIPVVAGPHNATEYGNIITQMMACGDVSSKEEGIELVKNSCLTQNYEPNNSNDWNNALEKYCEILGCM